MFRPASFVLALALSSRLAPAQEVGLLAGYGLNDHTASFGKLGSYPSCCPEFTSGSGGGVWLGAYGAIDLGPRLRLHGRLLYGNQGGTLADDERSFVADLRDTARVVPALFRHELTASLTSVGLEPVIGWRPFGGLEVMAGARIAVVTQATFRQTETLVEPTDFGSYVGADRVWVDTQADIPDVNTLRFGLVGGLRYSLPLNKDTSLVLAPEVTWVHDLSGVGSGVSWNAHTLRFTASVGWRRPAATVPELPTTTDESAPIVVEERPVATPPPAPVRLPLTGTIMAGALADDGSTLPVATLRVEEVIGSDLRPLLPYVYFAEGSADIPGRYRRRTAEATDGFREDALYAETTLGTYHHILDIIGSRMRAKPEATLTIVGCTAERGKDVGNALATARAAVIRRYLAEVWQIADKRLRTQVRGLPEKPTTAAEPTDIPLAHEENQRTEFLSSDPSILRPVAVTDTLRTANPPVVVFRTDAVAPAGLSAWRVDARQDTTLVFSASGYGPLPDRHTWTVAADRMRIPVSQTPVRYTLALDDNAGSSFRSLPQDIAVEQLTIRTKRVERIDDREIDRFSLILFDFNKANVGVANADILATIRSKIRPSSRVTITGSTDNIGAEAYNADLARQRATEVARALDRQTTSDVRSVGERSPYTVDLPEGRAYSRTVMIVVETPIR